MKLSEGERRLVENFWGFNTNESYLREDLAKLEEEDYKNGVKKEIDSIPTKRVEIQGSDVHRYIPDFMIK